MAAKSLSCPNCGAPLDYQEGDQTIRCKYCHASVMVPEELQDTPSEPVVQVVYYDSRKKAKNGSLLAWVILAVVILVVVISVAFPLLAAAGITSAVVISVGDIQKDMAQKTLTEAAVQVTPTRTPTPTPQPTPTVTPAFANPRLTFGKEGNGPGQFEDARYIAVDGEGFIYVAEYQGGRIQVFDPTGKYLSQWKVGSSKTIIDGLAASYQGEVFVSFDRDIVRYEGATGKELGRMQNPLGGEFGDLKATADGGVVAVWYEGRWGIITSLEGHREDAMVFSRDGKLVQTIHSPVSSLTESPALDVLIVMDGDGNVFLLDSSSLYKYSPEGKYLDRFGGKGEGAGQVDGAYSMAMDGQGRIYVGGSRDVYVFSVDGAYLTSFPVENTAYAIAIDHEGDIWVLSRQMVTRYVLKDK